MKIKINEKETYEIELDDEVSLQGLKDLVKRIEILSNITPTLSTPSLSTPSLSKPKRKYNISNDDLKDIKCVNCSSQRFYKKGYSKSGLRRLVCKNCKVSFTVDNGNIKKEEEETFSRRKPMQWKGREDIINALKIHYFGSKAEKMEFAKDKETSWSNINKSFHGLRKRFNISPQEVGLQEFPFHKQGRPKESDILPKIPTPTFPTPTPTPTPPLELKPEGNEQEDGTGISFPEGNREKLPKQKWWNK